MEYTLKSQKVSVFNPKNNTVSQEHLIAKLDMWTILFFYPADFSVICPTELESLNKLYSEFCDLWVKILVVSRDSQYTHKNWIEKDERLKNFQIEMISDVDWELAEIFNFPLLNKESKVYERATIILDRKWVMQYIEISPESVWRNIEEYLKKIKALEYVKNNEGTLCQEWWEEHQEWIQDTLNHKEEQSSFSKPSWEYLS